MGLWFHLAQMARLVFWLLLIGLLLLQVLGGGDATQKSRDILLEQFQSERKSRVIALIHRQESHSILGVPVSSFINIEDSEAVLRAIRSNVAPQNKTALGQCRYLRQHRRKQHGRRRC